MKALTILAAGTTGIALSTGNMILYGIVGLALFLASVWYSKRQVGTLREAIQTSETKILLAITKALAPHVHDQHVHRSSSVRSLDISS